MALVSLVVEAPLLYLEGRIPLPHRSQAGAKAVEKDCFLACSLQLPQFAFYVGKDDSPRSNTTGSGLGSATSISNQSSVPHTSAQPSLVGVISQLSFPFLNYVQVCVMYEKNKTNPK